MQTAIRKEFAYLNRLRKSGVVNMWGAGEYLADEFGYESTTARKIVADWREWVSEDAANRDRGC